MPKRTRSGQNKITFEVPELFDAPILQFDEGDGFIVPEAGSRVEVEGRTWLVDHVTHRFPGVNQGGRMTAKQEIRVVMRDPAPAFT